MRQYLLDSTPLAGFLNGRKHFVDTVYPLIANAECSTSILVYAELTEYNMGLSNFERRQDDLRQVHRSIYPIFPTYPILDRYAAIRRQLRPPGGPGLIGDIDTLIAATAMQLDLTLVTADSDFQRVQGLKLMLLPRTG